MGVQLGSLTELDVKYGVRSASALAQSKLSVGPVLARLLPQGLPKGNSIQVSSPSITLLLLAAVTQAGSWAATVGHRDLGWVAASEAGVVLPRCAAVRAPGRQSAKVIAALIDSVDLVVLHDVGTLSAGDARRLIVRARERQTTLLLDNADWPIAASAVVSLRRSAWEGMQQGDGHLRGRWVDLHANGRGALNQGRQVWEWWGSKPSQNRPPVSTADIVTMHHSKAELGRHVS